MINFKNRILFILNCFLFCLVIVSENVNSQDIYGSLQGEIIDKVTKKALPYVNVIVEGTKLGAAASEEGKFYIPRIPVGLYNIKFSIIGYKPIVKSGVMIKPNRKNYILAELQETPIQLEGITVTPTYFEKSSDAILSERTVDFEDIRQDPGSAEDIQRTMQVLPAVVSGSDQVNEIIVRGGMPGENLFLMDNIEIPNPNHFGNQGTTGGPMNMINTYFVRQVDFYTGAFPARFGDKVSSVMNIKLREGNRERFEGNGNLGMAGAGILLEGPINKGKGSFIVSARKSFLDLIISSTGLTAVPYYYNLQGKLVYNISNRTKMITNAIYGDDKIFIEGGEEESVYQQGVSENIDAKSQQYAFGTVFRTIWSEKIFSDITVSRVGNYWRIKVIDEDGYDIYNNKSDEFITEVKGDIFYHPGEGAEISSGLLVKKCDFNHDIWSKPDTIYTWDTSQDLHKRTGIFKVYPKWKVLQDVSSYKYAAYLQLKRTWMKRFVTNIGLRYDYFNYNNYGKLNLRFGLSFILSDKASLNFGYGYHTQSPSFIELTANPKNKSLKGKITEQFIVGLEYLLAEDTKCTVELYNKYYKNVIVPYEWTTPDPYDSYSGWMVNSGKGHARGIEFFLQKKLSRNLQYIISYAHSIAKGYDLRHNKYYNWDYDYRNIFTFIGGYKVKFMQKEWYKNLKNKLFYKIFSFIIPFGDETIISLRWRYLGGRPYTMPVYHKNLHTWVTEDYLALNSNRFPEYHKFDLRIDRRYYFNKWNMVTYFDIMNVYNRDNIWDYSYKENGTIEKILQFKTLPVGGIAIEF